MQRYDVISTLAGLVSEEDLFVQYPSPPAVDDWWNNWPGGDPMSGAYHTFAPAGMGCAAPTALGIALALPHRRVVDIDTDGSILLNVGSLCVLGNTRLPNLTIIVLDNQMYECIGGPPSPTAGNTDIARMAEGAGCVNCMTVRDLEAFRTEALRMLNDGQFGLLVAKIDAGVHPWPSERRKVTDGVEEKYRFLRHVERIEGRLIHSGAPHGQAPAVSSDTLVP